MQLKRKWKISARKIIKKKNNTTTTIAILCSQILLLLIYFLIWFSSTISIIVCVRQVRQVYKSHFTFVCVYIHTYIFRNMCECMHFLVYFSFICLQSVNVLILFFLFLLFVLFINQNLHFTLRLRT